MAKALNVSLAVTADTGQAKAALQQLQQTLTQLTTTASNISIGGQLKQDAVEATRQIAQLQNMLKSSTNQVTGNLDLTKFNQALQTSGTSLSTYQKALSSMGSSGSQAFAKLAQSISQAEVPLRRSNAMLKEFGTVLQNTVRWQLSSSLIHGFMGTIQHAVGYAQDLNESLNKIQIVTQASDEHMANFAKSANEAAKRLSTTTTTYTDASLIYYQQGLSDREVAERTEVTIKMANAAGVSAQKVSDQMTAVWNNFDDGSHSLEYYADVMTALGAATASSTDEISTGLSKFASVADTVGLSYENAAAALATITATTRNSADTVGTGLRTLFSRLQSVKLGETLEDGVDLTKYSAAIATMGVNVLDVNGELKSMDQIIDEMGAKWQYLNDTQKTAIAQTVGGVRQYTNLIALLDNYDFYKQNQQVALNSEGTVQKQADIYAKSWEAAQKRVKASAESIYSDLLNDKFFIGLNDGFSHFLDLIHNTINAMGGLKGIFLAIGGIATTVFGKQLSTGLQNIVYDLKMLTPGGREQVQNLQRQGNQLLIDAYNAQGTDFGKTMASAYTQQSNLSEAYLANASRMDQTQQRIAQSLLQQQQALIKNVELSAQEVVNQTEKSKILERDTRRNANQALGTYSKAGNIAQATEYYRKAAVSVGKIDTLVNTQGFFDLNTTKGLTDAQQKLQQLGLTIQDFANFTPAAQTAFKNFSDALNAKDINAAQQAFTQLENEINNFGAKNFEAGIDRFAARLETLGPKGEAAAKALREMAASGELAGKAAVDEATNLGVLEQQTSKAAQAMQEIAKKNYSMMDSFVALAGFVTSFAMALNSLHNIIETINDDSLSLGEKFSSIALSLTPITMMISNFSKNVLPQLLSLGSKVALSFGAVNQAAGTTGAAVASMGASIAGLAGVLGVIALAIGAIVTAAQLIDTPKEKIARFNKALENSRTAADEAKSAYNDLTSAFGAYDDAIKKTDELTAGTNEYAAALAEANAQARQLIKDADLSSDDWTYSNGKYIIKESARDRVLAAAEQKMQAAETEAAVTAIDAEFGTIFTNFDTVLKANEALKYFSNPATAATFGAAAPGGDIASMIATTVIKEQARKAATDLGFESADAFLEAYQTQGADLFKEALANSDFGNSVKNFLVTSLSNDSAFKGQEAELSKLADIYGRSSIELFGDELSRIQQEALDEHVASGWWNHLFGIGDNSLEKLQQELKGVMGEEAYSQFLASDTWKNTEGNINKQLEIVQEQLKTAKIQKYIQDKAEKDVKTYSRLLFQGEELTRMSSAERDTYFKELNSKPDDVIHQSLKEEAAQTIADVSSSLTNAIVSSTDSSFVLSQEEANKLFQNYSLDQINGIANVISTFGSSFGKNATTPLTQELIDQLVNNDTSLFKQLQEANLTGDRIIDYATMRNIGAKSNSKSVQDAINNLIDTSMAEQGGKAGLFEELYGSENFKDNLKAIQKQFKKTGKIGGDAIESMAESSEYLADFLDSSGMNAETLADILNSIEMGDIGVDQLSDQLIDAMTAASALENSLAQTFSYIDNFQQERSVRDIGKFYKGLSDSVQEGWESGMLLDPQATQAWGEMFGASSLAKYRNKVAELTNDRNLTPEQISKELNSTFEAEVKAMQSIQKYGDLSGMFEYYANTNSRFKDMFSFNSETGQVTAVDESILKRSHSSTGKTFDTIEGFIEGLIDRGISADLARSMANEYAATNGSINKLWRTSAAEEGQDILLKKTLDNRVLTTNELKAFYNQYKDILDDMYGINPEDEDGFNKYLEKMRPELAKTGKLLADLGDDFDYAKASYSTLAETMKKQGGDLNEYFKAAIDRSLGEGEAYTIDELTDAYIRLGFTGEQAYKLIDEQIEASGETLETYLAKTGELAEEGIRSLGDFEQYLADHGKELAEATAEDWASYLDYTDATVKLQEQADIMAEAVRNSFEDLFTDLEIKIEFSADGSLATLKIQTKEAIEEGAASANIATATKDIANNIKQVSEEVASGQKSSTEIQAEFDSIFGDIETQIAALQEAQTNAITEIANAAGEAEKQLQLAQDNMTKALQELQEGNIQQAQNYLTQAEHAADLAQTAAEDAKKIQQEMLADAQEQAKAAEKAAAEKVTAIEAMLEAAKNDASETNQAFLDKAQSELDAANEAHRLAQEAAAKATQAAIEGSVAEAQQAAQEAKDAAAKAQEAASNVAQAVNNIGAMTFEGETPVYSDEERAQFAEDAKNLGADIVDFFKLAAKSLKSSGSWDENEQEMTVQANTEGLDETQEQLTEVTETFTTAKEETSEPLKLEADTSSLQENKAAISDYVDAILQAQNEVEANAMQTHLSDYLNTPEGREAGYALLEDYAKGLSGGSDEYKALEAVLDLIEHATNDIATNTENTANLAEKEAQEKNVVDAYDKKPSSSITKASDAELELVEQIEKGGWGTSKAELKALDNLASSTEAAMMGVSQSVVDAVGNLKAENNGQMISSERVSQVQAQQELGKAINLKAHIDMDEAMAEAESYIDLNPINIPAKVTKVDVDESTGDTEMTVELDANADVEQAKADIEALGGQVLEESVDGDVTSLRVAIDGQNNRWLTAYVGGDVGALSSAINSQDGRHITVTVDYEEGDTSGLEKAEGSASGRNNGNGRFATGKHLGNKYQGLAEVGELGPELMLHRGMPFLAGVNGRTVAYVEPDDEIYTAAQTKRILENNPTLWDLPGFSVGYNRVTWGNSGGGGGYGSGAKSSNKKSAKFDPERYHLISRQIDDINRRYERLDKISDKAFGKNKVKAIQDIIDVTDDLIAAQEQLISEANAYVNQDLATLRAYGVPVTLDEHGNLQNFEQLQEMYGRPATESEDNDTKEYYQTIWKAIQQYEESVDKLNEAYERYDDLIYQLAELELEQFTARVEMKIDYDDKSLKLLDHYINKINDDIYKTAEVFELTESKLNTNLHKLDSYYDGIEKIMMTLHDQDGNLIKGMSLDKFLGLTDAQRDALRVSSDDMEAIADYLEEMVDVMEEMDDEKLNWTEKLSQAFDELNEKVENGLNLFDHYQSLLENLSNISDLMGTGITPQSRKLLKDLNIGLLRNTQNSMIAAKDYLDTLEQAAAQTKWLIMNESDTELKQAYQEQLDEIEGMIRDTQENILSYWETMLEMAQDMYTNAIDQALQDYERSFAGLYVTLDRMGEAYDRRKEIQSQYVEDYEKYYQLSKLDRDIVKTIDELAANASKHSKNLTDLLNEVRELQKNGQKLSEYDIEVLQKKYELEKARAELEEAREAKTTVRLQRNRDGSWGYVYTADEDKISELEANLEEAIYNYQKLNDEQIHRLQDNMADFVKTMHDAVNDIMSDTTTTYEEKMFQLQELNKDFISQQNYLFSEMNKAMNNQGSTYSRALDIYKGKTSELGDAFVDLEDTFAETVLAQILGVENLDVYKSEMTDNWNELLDTTKEALDEYQARVDDINKTAGTTTKNFYDDATKWIEAIGKTSGETTSDVQKLGDELSTQFKRIAEEAKDFAAMWKEKMREVTGYTEPFVTQLTSILGIMNDAYDAFGIADGTAGQVYADRIVGSGRNNNNNITASDNGPASVYNPYADIEAQYLALQQQLEDQYAAYQNEILNYYNDVQNNIAAALGDLTNNWNSILNTQSSLMGYGLNTTPNLAGLMGLDSGWNQNINIAADFPGVTSSFEIEEAFNNLVNKATQYANRW